MTLRRTNPEDGVERLHMHYVRDLIYRLRRGQSERAIASDLKISRVTVRKYHTLADAAGFCDPTAPLPDGRALVAALGPVAEPPKTPSSVEPYRTLVADFVADGVEMMTIFDRLSKDHGYAGSYSSIRRFVHHLQPVTPMAVVRVHTAPGEEVQVDFGAAGPFLDPVTDRVRPAYVFVMTLAFSRHQYAELVFDQQIATWIACHRQAFESFGGVPQRIVLDNLKAAVLVAALHDPVLGEAYRRFAQHYDLVVSPNRPRTPEHKGKVESGVHFIKRSFLAAQEFADIREANRRLAIWIRERAGTRDHGTTHQAPLSLFKAEEQAVLRPLPARPFDLTETKQVKIHPDCHAVIAGSYYSVPHRYVGWTLDAFMFERVVQLFAGTDLVATHPRALAKGTWRTRDEHYPPDKAAFLQKTPRFCRAKAEQIGPSTSAVVTQLLADRPLDRLRSVQALLRLTESVGPKRLEAACARALHFGDVRYRRIKDILNAALDHEPLPEAPDHPAEARRDGEMVFLFARSAIEFFEAEALG
jgi:transposase